MKDESEGKASLTRRDFSRGPQVGLLRSPGWPSEAFAVGTKETAAAAGPMPKKWDETYDVVVIGSGFAGLAAAIEAKNAGSSAVVIEKMAVHGGNSIINGGDFLRSGDQIAEGAG